MSESEVNSPGARGLTTRLAIGVAQGLALYALHRWGDQVLPPVRSGMVLSVGLVPIVALGAIGVMRRLTLVLWLTAAVLITLGLGAYGGFVNPPERGAWISPAVAFFTAVTLFILHHLILSADAERRWRASYERYFDEAWKAAVRLALAVLFVGALWLLLWLGAALFNLIGLDFLQRLIRKPWFAYPATTTFFAIAVHITDVRAGLVRGTRTLLLSLLSWLLPLLAVIAAGFVLALPFTGLKPLWATRSASGVMLAACAALLILINATYQDGERKGFPPRVLKWATRIAAVTLAPLTAVAAYGVLLRISQHGLTPQRIYALACLVVAGCYAVGYAWATLSRGPWMKQLELTNWVSAQIAVLVLLLIFSPLLDPARISVASQLHRLQSGAISSLAFDLHFLRFGSGRWGQAALRQMAQMKGGARETEIAERARAELTLTNRWERPAPTSLQRSASIQPVGPLPPGFLTQVWSPNDDPTAECGPPEAPTGVPAPPPCLAVALEIDSSPGPEVVVFGPRSYEAYGLRSGRWVRIGTFFGAHCENDLAAVRGGRARTAPSARVDLEIDGRRLPLTPPAVGCPPVRTGAKPAKAAARQSLAQ